MNPLCRLCLTACALTVGLTGCSPAGNRSGGDPVPDPPPADADGRSPPEYVWRELKGALGAPLTAAFSPDGKMIATAAGDTIQVWTTDTGEPVTRMQLPEKQFLVRMVFSPDGKKLVSEGREDPLVRTWDLKTGKQVGEWRHHERPTREAFSSPFLAFSPDGRVMAVRFFPPPPTYMGLALRDVSTGKTLLEMPNHMEFFRVDVDFSPDGKLMATTGEGDGVSLWDVGTGKQVRELRKAVDRGAGPLVSGEYIRFSPDGRFLVTRESTGVVEIFHQSRTVIWGVADGKRYATFDKGSRLSADNRYLMLGDGDVRDLLIDRIVPIANRVAHRHLTAVSPDGKTLAFVGPASGSKTGQSLYLTPAPVLLSPFPEKGNLSAEQLGVAWGGWASTNEFARAYCGKALAARPAQVVESATSTVGPVPADARERVEDILKRLDDDSPDVRDKASAEVRGVAVEFQPLLSSVLKAAPVGEVRNRLTAVLNEVEGAKPSGNQVAEQRRWAVNQAAGLPTSAPLPPKLAEGLRALALLEHIGSAEAKKVLERVAAGAAGARLTEEASAALKRLGK